MWQYCKCKFMFSVHKKQSSDWATTHVMANPNEIRLHNTQWHVQTAIPTGHVMAKAAAESVLDYVQPFPQQKRVIKLLGINWKGCLERLLHAVFFPAEGTFDSRSIRVLLFVIFHLRELKQRWCCLLKNKDIVASAPLSFLPFPSNKFY